MSTGTRVARAVRPPPDLRLEQGAYRVRFATSEAEIDAILRLRFEVFNLEMGEGLASSFATGRDEDGFDARCHHLLVEEISSGAVVGTYRMQTGEMAGDVAGFYSAGEFQLEDLPATVVSDSVEVGRACIARDHRSRVVLFLLWRGLAAYLAEFGKRYLFGCCSLSSQTPAEGLRLLDQLEERGCLHPELRVRPRDELACRASPREVSALAAIEVPQLFGTYLRYGAQVLGPPALDREFGTIDYFVLLDVNGLDARTYRLFFP